MKNLIYLVLFSWAIFLWPPLSYAQPNNEAFILELNSNNIDSLVDSIPILMLRNFPFASPPSDERLHQFLSAPFSVETYIYQPGRCTKPGIIAYESNLSYGISTRFSNTNRNQGDKVLLGALDFNPRPAIYSFGDHSPSYFISGQDFPMNMINNRILLFGSLCENCPHSATGKSYSNMEIIIIVEKNLLRSD